MVGQMKQGWLENDESTGKAGGAGFPGAAADWGGVLCMLQAAAGVATDWLGWRMLLASLAAGAPQGPTGGRGCAAARGAAAVSGRHTRACVWGSGRGLAPAPARRSSAVRVDCVVAGSSPPAAGCCCCRRGCLCCGGAPAASWRRDAAAKGSAGSRSLSRGMPRGGCSPADAHAAWPCPCCCSCPRRCPCRCTATVASSCGRGRVGAGCACCRVADVEAVHVRSQACCSGGGPAGRE